MRRLTLSLHLTFYVFFLLTTDRYDSCTTRTPPHERHLHMTFCVAKPNCSEQHKKGVTLKPLQGEQLTSS